jgi:hypothetical protein
MVNLLHIAEGWGKSLGWLDVSPEDQQVSIERMKICAVCPFAKESNFLKLLKGEARDMDAIYCTKCGCPVNEKTLVTDEKCPEKKW